MRVAIDLRTLLEPFESGVTIYTKSMVLALMKEKGLDLDLFYQSKEPCERIQNLFPKARHIPISNTKFHLKSLFLFPDLPEGYFRKVPDLIWIPDRRPFYKTEIPLVMTIHDFVPEKVRASLSMKSKIWHMIFPLRRLLNLSRGVLVPSSSVAAELPRRVLHEVTYEGAAISKAAKIPKALKSQKKMDFVLSISPLDPRKRLKWILKVSKDLPNLNFVIAGVKPGDSRFSSLRIKKQKNLFLLGEVSEEEKAWLLKHSRALLALSAYEGFDLPVLEAVRAKCPVIMSDISVHRELYRPDAVFVKTYAEFRSALHRARKVKLRVPATRGDYTWEKAARRALLFFRRIVVNENS